MCIISQIPSKDFYSGYREIIEDLFFEDKRKGVAAVLSSGFWFNCGSI
jgi:hypothetical protein